MSAIDDYWIKFLKETHRTANEICSGDINFGSNGFTNDSQIALVLAGNKTAFFSSLASYTIDNEILPVAGELYILLDRQDEPRCIIEILSVNIVPLDEVTWEMAKKEGEDFNLEQWKEKTLEYLNDEADILGYEVVPNLKLVYQTFKVVYK